MICHEFSSPQVILIHFSGSFHIRFFFFLPSLSRPESNLTGPFASTNACARRTTPTLTVTRWTSICLRPKKPKPRLWSWWGYARTGGGYLFIPRELYCWEKIDRLPDTHYVSFSSRQKLISSLRETANLWLLLFKISWQVSAVTSYLLSGFSVF